ncbi:hypothetical protein [Pseudobacter ginsenosidimutans]|uniref:Uncharacterized protein n=1 Tax=Pseudobacter ginsenosidimutans TaxID=661488 RepID=A0A4Q7MMT8_9BACT|nr:hypothetical protein [Pseudobacter ginsenosidimutans]QEC40401.1 hypothetical protein FSB84_01340 [Pseudobacter ginsenosidimutans]RZS68993.1 hypothetical protein EV199_4817 [Pseudobacter ginsenosidimutans]
MKTSNKIIALIFGLLILIPALVVATIIIKYKSGNFTRLDVKSGMITQTFPGIKNITLRDLRNLYVIPSDSLYAEITTNENYQPVKFSIQGDAVLIYADSVRFNGNDPRNNEQEYQRRQNSVWLYLPAAYTALIENCGVTLSADSKKAEPEGISLQLINSSINDDIKDSSGVRFRKLTITGDRSLIGFGSHFQAGEMDLSLKNRSSLDISNSNIGNLLLNADSSTSIHLSGQQLKSVIQKK